MVSVQGRNANTARSMFNPVHRSLTPVAAAGGSSRLRAAWELGGACACTLAPPVLSCMLKLGGLIRLKLETKSRVCFTKKGHRRVRLRTNSNMH